jgi:anti-sigma-K factor RskA
MSAYDHRGGDGECGGNAAPYVLGALTKAEHEAFALHLVSCAVCREEVAALESVAASLPAAAPQIDAPPELKKRVMSAVYEDAERDQASHVDDARTSVARRRRAWWPAFAPLAIASACIVALVVVLATSSGTGGESKLIRARVSAPGASASVLVSGAHAQLTIANMPQSPPGRVYQVWIERSRTPAPTNALFTVSSRGSATVGVPGSITGVKELLVTSEPLGGSRVPTRAPVITAKLS